MNKIVVACFASLLSVAAFGARAISAFSVETGENGNTVFNLAFDAGNAGDSHALYYAWSNDGKDYGEDPAGWPNVLRVGRVADDATEFSLRLRLFTRPALFSQNRRSPTIILSKACMSPIRRNAISTPVSSLKAARRPSRWI